MLRIKEILRMAEDGTGAPAPAPAAAPVAAPTPAPAPAPADNKFGVSSDVESIFRFDPFEQAASPAGQQPPTDPVAAPPVGAGGPPSSGPTPEEVAALASKGLQLQGEVAGLREALNRPQYQAPPPAAPTGPTLPAYNFEVPDALIVGMRSENPLEVKNALAAMAAGVAANTHQRVVDQMRQEFATVLERYVGEQLQVSQQRQHVTTDYYGKYPHHGHPLLKPVVAEAFRQVSAKYGGNLQWGSMLRDEIAGLVEGAIGSAPVQARPSQPAQQPPTMVAPGIGARPNVQQPNSIDQQIAELSMFGIN